MLPKEIRQKVEALAEEDYRIFHQWLVPVPVRGVRIPQLRKLAADLSTEERKEVLQCRPPFDFEESLLYAFCLGRVKDADAFTKGLEIWVGAIDNWATCDCGTSSLKPLKRDPERYLPFVEACLTSNREFVARFGSVAIFTHFRHKGVDWCIRQLERVVQEDYYAQMAVAWALQVLMVDDFETVFGALGRFSSKVVELAVKKGRESYRLNTEQKERLKYLRVSVAPAGGKR